MCMCALYFQDELARVLVTLFDSRHLLYQLLWNMFSKEVELADSMQTLFRGNSLASKIMTFCFKVENTAWVLSWNDPVNMLYGYYWLCLCCLMSGIWGSIPAEATGAFTKRGHHHPWTHQLWGGPHQVSTCISALITRHIHIVRHK